MSKKGYILTGIYNKMCTHGGVKIHPAKNGRPEKREIVSLRFVPGVVTETDLDMSAVVEAGFIRCVSGKAYPKKAPADPPAVKPVKTDDALTEVERIEKEKEEAAAKKEADRIAAKEEEEKKAAMRAAVEKAKAEEKASKSAASGKGKSGGKVPAAAAGRKKNNSKKNA